MPAETAVPPTSIRILLVVVGLAIWYGTQALIKFRPNGVGVLGDGLHVLTERGFRYLSTHPRAADLLLGVSSFGIDCLGVFVLVQSVIGPSLRPFVGLFLVFVARQICQALCALPPPA